MGSRYRVYENEDIYLSQREAECVTYILYGRTIRAAAEQIGISSRTVEDYIVNARKKLNCNTKFELIEKIANSDFEKDAAMLVKQVKAQNNISE